MLFLSQSYTYMSYTYMICVYLIVIFAASVCCLITYKDSDKASKIFSIFVTFSFVNEVGAFIGALAFKNNMPISAIYSPIEFFIISVYFNYTIDIFHANKIGYIVGFIGLLFGVVDIFIQGLYVMNTYFLIFEGISIIVMSLFSFLQLLRKNDQIKIQFYHHFWFTAILVFFWAATFAKWCLYSYFLENNPGWLLGVNIGGLIFNSIFYLGIAVVFTLIPKMQIKYGR